MKIAIISDIHDNIPNLTKVLDYCRENKIKKIICCGDLASLETLDFLNDNFAGEIFFVFGNMDNDYLKNYPFENNQYKNTQVFKDFGEIEIENNPEKPAGHGARKIAFVHFPREARELCETGKYDFVFHGHTHKPWAEIINNCTLLNPGNVANQYYPPTFATWNTNNNSFELMRINELL
jgi:uncharacterized protein